MEVSSGTQFAQLLIRAFAGEVLEQVQPASIRERLEELMLEALPRG